MKTDSPGRSEFSHLSLAFGRSRNQLHPLVGIRIEMNARCGAEAFPKPTRVQYLLGSEIQLLHVDLRWFVQWRALSWVV